MKLSPRQAEVLGFVRAEIERAGTPPSIREIARGFGVTYGAVADVMQALERKGYIAREPGKDRAIKVLRLPSGEAVSHPKFVSGIVVPIGPCPVCGRLMVGGAHGVAGGRCA